MKVFLKKRISLFTIIFIVLAALQYFIALIGLNQVEDMILTRGEIRTILFIILIMQLFVMIFLISFLPGSLKRMFKGVVTIIDDISRGNYSQSINLDEYRAMYDKELVEVVDSLKKMLGIILKFDSLKKDKIQEQRGRIIALLNLTENGFMIINHKGEIVYANHLIKEHFPTMSEDKNIVETNFGLDIDNNIKKYVTEIVKNQSKNRPKQFYMASMKRHIALKSELVRDTDGNYIGAVIGVFNLSKREPDKQ